MKAERLVGLVCVLVAAGAAPGGGAHEEGLALHGPIMIEGDGDFCDDDNGDGRVDGADDGVVNCDSADGSAERPYRIEGWRFEVDESAPAIFIKRTNSHVVIAGNHIAITPGMETAPWRNVAGVWLWPADHVTVRDNTFTGLVEALNAYWTTDHLRVERNTFEGNVFGVTQVTYAGTMELRHNRFEDHHVAVEAGGDQARIRDNDFIAADTAVLVRQGAGEVTVRHNNLPAGGVAIDNRAASMLDGTCNHWGHPDGPGAGSDVSGWVDTNPYRTEPVPHAGPEGQRSLLPPTSQVPRYVVEACDELLEAGPI